MGRYRDNSICAYKKLRIACGRFGRIFVNFSADAFFCQIFEGKAVLVGKLCWDNGLRKVGDNQNFFHGQSAPNGFDEIDIGKSGSGAADAGVVVVAQCNWLNGRLRLDGGFKERGFEWQESGTWGGGGFGKEADVLT